MPGENLRKTGKEMEDLAADYLSSRGVRILERNFRSREAEIDIIAQQDRTLLFVEVKARKAGEKSGDGLEAVGSAKQKRICRCADFYDCAVRWIRNAFPYIAYSRAKPHWRVW